MLTWKKKSYEIGVISQMLSFVYVVGSINKLVAVMLHSSIEKLDPVLLIKTFYDTLFFLY